MAGMATNLARPGLPSGQACREVGVGKNRGEQSAEGVGHNAEAAAPAKEEVGNEADAAEFATEGGGLEKNRGSEPEAEDAGYEAEAVEPAKKKGGLDISCGERGALDISHGAQGAELATQKVGFDEIHSEMARRRSASRRRGPRRRRGRKSAWAWATSSRARHPAQGRRRTLGVGRGVRVGRWAHPGPDDGSDSACTSRHDVQVVEELAAAAGRGVGACGARPAQLCGRARQPRRLGGRGRFAGPPRPQRGVVDRFLEIWADSIANYTKINKLPTDSVDISRIRG